jgi:hypothetical protein
MITPPWKTADMKYVKKLLYDNDRPYTCTPVAFSQLGLLFFSPPFLLAFVLSAYLGQFFV